MPSVGLIYFKDISCADDLLNVARRTQVLGSNGPWL